MAAKFPYFYLCADCLVYSGFYGIYLYRRIKQRCRLDQVDVPVEVIA